MTSDKERCYSTGVQGESGKTQKKNMDIIIVTGNHGNKLHTEV